MDRAEAVDAEAAQAGRQVAELQVAELQVAERDSAPAPVSKRRRLVARFLLLIFPLTAFIVLALQLATGVAAYRMQAGTLRSNAEITADLTASTLSLPVWNLDSGAIRAIVEGLRRHPDLIDARVVDEHGAVMHATPRAGRADLAGFAVDRPIVAPEGVRLRIGTLQLVYSEASLRQIVDREIALGAAAVVALLVSLTGAILLVLRGTVLRPLSLLLRAIAQVERGTWATVPWRGRDEIARLIDAFNAMVGRLAEGEQARAALADEQERAAASEREAQLRRAGEDRLRSILDALPVPVMMIRFSDQWVIWRNRKNEEMFDLPQLAAPVPPQFSSWRNPEDRAQIVRWVQATGRVEEFESEMVLPSGWAFPVIITAAPMTFSNDPACLLAILDISGRKRAEDELRAAKQQAERALDDLKAAQASLVEAEKLASLGGLVAGVAHEINTPIGVSVTAVSHMADRLARIADQTIDGRVNRGEFERFVADAKETTQLLASNLGRAAELIRSFKQVAVDQTHEIPRRFFLREYIEEIALSLKPKIRRGGHKLRIDCDPLLDADGYPGPLAQVLTNLIVNAVTHAFPEGLKGRLSIAVTEPEPNRLRLLFADDGAGIPADALPHIFEPFFTTKRGSGGTGLGLHIVYNIVKGKLMGDIAVKSAVGQGTTFTIEFPRRFGAAAADDAARPAAVASAG